MKGGGGAGRYETFKKVRKWKEIQRKGEKEGRERERENEL